MLLVNILLQATESKPFALNCVTVVGMKFPVKVSHTLAKALEPQTVYMGEKMVCHRGVIPWKQ